MNPRMILGAVILGFLAVTISVSAATGHFPTTTLGYHDTGMPRAYTVDPNYRQDGGSLDVAKSTITTGNPTDLWVNFEFDTGGKSVYIQYTTDGSEPNKSNGSTVTCSFSNYIEPRRVWVGTIPSGANVAGTHVKYLFYISDSTLGAAWGKVDANGYTTSWDEGNNVGFSYRARHVTTGSGGNWNTSGSWKDGYIPNAATHEVEILSGATIALDTNPSVFLLQINSGGTFQGGSGNTLTVAAGGTLGNSGTFTRQTGKVLFGGVGTVSGTVAFYDVAVAGAVDFGANVSIYNTLEILAGGAVANAGSITYQPNSTLLYNNGSGYNVYNEWKGGVSSGPGVPHHVQITGSSTLSFASSSQTRTALGNVTIDGSASLQLSNTSGGDLHLRGNWNRLGTFLPNSRAVEFNGSGTQTINGTTTFDYLTINNASSSGVQLNNDINVNNQLSIGSGAKLDAQTQAIIMASGSTLLANGSFVGGSGMVLFSGVGTISGSGTATFNNLTASGSTDFGTISTVQGVLTLNAGAFAANGTQPTYATSSVLRYNAPGPYTRGDEWLPNVTTGAGVPYHVEVVNGTSLAVGGAAGQTWYVRGGLLIDGVASWARGPDNSGTLAIAGNFALSNGGQFDPNYCTVLFNGTSVVSGTASFYHVTATGDVDFGTASTVYGTLKLSPGGSVSTNGPTYGGTALLNYDTNYIAGVEWRANGLAQPGLPVNVLVSAGRSVSFPAGPATNWMALGMVTVNGSLVAPEGVLRLMSGLAVNIGGSFNANNGTLVFDSASPQTFIAHIPITVYDMVVGPGTTLTEFVNADNITVGNSLVNMGIIRKIKAIPTTGVYGCGLTHVSATVTQQGTLAVLQVDRMDSLAPNANGAIQPNQHWSITPTGAGYTLNLTLPHHLANPAEAYLARWTGTAWTYGRASATANTVTLNNVQQLSTWAIAAPAPTLDLNGPAPGIDFAAVFSEKGGPVAVVDAAQLTLTDPDSTQMTTATVTLASAPNGALESLDADVSATSLTKSYNPATRMLTLSGADVVATYQKVLRSVTYNNTSNNPDVTTRTLTFVVYDDTGIACAPAQTLLSMIAVNDPPVLSHNTGILVAKSGTVTISGTHLQYSDPDNTPAQLIYTLVAPMPTEGTLKLNSVALNLNDTFTQDDLNNFRVTYAHGGADNPGDSFAFTLTDGLSPALNGTFAITITGTNSAPTVIVNLPLVVAEDAGGTITQSLLHATDAEQGPGDLDFLLGQLPVNGTLYLGAAPLGPGGSFTQVDIANNLLRYVHNGNETTTDSFTFIVDDGQGGQSPTTKFDIQITPVNDPPVPVANAPLILPRGGAAAITPALLAVSDVDNTPAQLVFTVQTPTANGILSNNSVPIGAGGTFTQDDIDNGRVQYQHDGGPSLGDGFTFTVSDGAGGSLPLDTFVIQIIPPTSVEDWRAF